MFSDEHIKFLKKLRFEKFIILLFRFLIVFIFLFLWQLLVDLNVLNSFILSSPLNVVKTLISLFKSNTLFEHIFVTLYEVLICFVLTTLVGVFVASILWLNKILAKIFDPFLTILNSLPKVSLGPIIIIWFGANVKSIIIMALLISVMNSVISIFQGFKEVDNYKITLMQSLGANKFQIFTKLVFRSNIPSLANTLKINISLSLIGVIMGELLVSKKGLGYLINYGSDIFNLNLVITSIFILGIISYLFYFIVNRLTKNIS